jgi:type IV pilus assembly protein PilM
MSILGIFKKEYIIGLDLGSSSIKVAQFIEKKDGLHLVRAELKEIDISQDDASNEKDTLLALSHLFRDVNLKKSKVIATVNCPQTAVKKITTPFMPKSELRQGIMLEMKNYFPFAVDESILDFEVLEEIENKGVRQYEVLLNVCPIKSVEKNISLFTKARIKPYSVVGSSYALQKTALRIKSSAEASREEATCLIDIGGSHTELVINKGRMLMFARKLPISGNDFTKALTGALTSDRGKTQLSMQEAEKIKREVGIPPEGESEVIDNKVSTSQIRAMLMAPLEQLTSEIERSIGYHREDSGGSKIGSIMLFGGGSSLKGLAQHLSKNLEMDVTIGNSFEGLLVEKSVMQGAGDISNRLELAISAATSEEKGINLLPAEIKNEKVMVVKRGMLEAIAAGLILVLLFVYMGMNIQLGNLKKRISVAKLELSSLEPQLRKSEAQLIANKVLADEPYWEDIFTELSNVLPDTARLTSFNVSNNIITMKGIISAKDGEQALSDLIIKLEKGIFNNVKLVSSKELGEDRGVEFELKCWIDYANS